ncbi:Ulp1 protease family, C-terminal catalytic domain containing protein [Parasponia andersonii]|uniref:Ulp1 protease family, C-terminal catalytic domain containing protein n=1 Tax=Parasponia andersonii TaxID=3476 RepID=A0A2P5CA42_PARAD|nr:Ulp1 protease family, C-terminal catalytic domain containing protein [Parasponia andersonii]
MQASGVLIHQLLLRKVKSKNPVELQFFIGDSTLRFGLGEFALITALNFSKDLDVVKYKSMSSSMRLRETYLNNKANVRSSELEAAFLNCEEKEDVRKLGFCYLVDGLLMAQESSTKILMDMLYFVENEEDFFNYPWGRRSYERTFPSLNKDMMYQRENYLQKMKKNKKAKEAKYTVYGFSITLQYWAYEAIPMLTGFIDNRKLIQLPTGDATTGFFFYLQTPWKWLADEYIDAAFWLIRECLWLFPKTYRKKVALTDTVYITCMNGRWDAFRKTSNKTKFLWDDQLTDYGKRDIDNFQPGREEVDEVYYPLNIGSSHWNLMQIDLPEHMPTVYDSDQALYDDACVEEAMHPMMKMLSYFLLNVERFADRDDLDLTTTTKPHDFDIRRLPPHIVPQTTKSGDCGVFIVKYLECLLADIPLSNVIDDVMQHSR